MAFDLVPHDRLLRKIAASGVDPRAVVCIREFLLGRTQWVSVGGQLSKEVRVKSGISQGTLLGPLWFLACVNDIWKNIESTTWLLAEDYIINRKILSNNDVENLQIDLNRLRECDFENKMIIKPAKSKTVYLAKALVMGPFIIH
jgi:hypothetical protein